MPDPARPRSRLISSEKRSESKREGCDAFVATPKGAFLAILGEQLTSAASVGSSAQQSSAGTASPGGTAQTGRERHRGQVERAAVEAARRLARRLERREGAPRRPAWARRAGRCEGR